MPNDDGFPVTPGSGRKVLVDHDLTAPDGTASVDAQGMKVLLGKAQTVLAFLAGRRVDGGTTDDDDAAAFVDPRLLAVQIKVTPTVSTSPAYTAKDAVGSNMTFAGAARANAGSGVITKVLVEDKGQQMAALDLVLFNTNPAAATDNAIFAPSDAELAPDLCVGVIPIGAYADFSTNSIATVPCNLPFVCAAGSTSLYGVLVARGTPTYPGASDIVVTLHILQD